MKQGGLGKIQPYLGEQERSRLYKGYIVDREGDQEWMPTQNDEIDMKSDFIHSLTPDPHVISIAQ
jgi:hypothetical protein